MCASASPKLQQKDVKCEKLHKTPRRSVRSGPTTLSARNQAFWTVSEFCRIYILFTWQVYTSWKVSEMLQSEEFDGHRRVTQSQATVVGTSSLVKPACKLKWPTATPAFTVALSDHLHSHGSPAGQQPLNSRWLQSLPPSDDQPVSSSKWVWYWLILIYMDQQTSQFTCVALATSVQNSLEQHIDICPKTELQSLPASKKLCKRRAAGESTTGSWKCFAKIYGSKVGNWKSCDWCSSKVLNLSIGSVESLRQTHCVTCLDYAQESFMSKSQDSQDYKGPSIWKRWRRCSQGLPDDHHK